MKIIVVEDEKKWNEKIVKIINQILEEQKLNIEITSFYDYTKELEKIIASKEINFYILDIELPSKSGFDITKKLRREINDWQSLVTITSVHEQQSNFVTKSLYILGFISKFDDLEINLRENILLGINILRERGYISCDKDFIKNDILYVQKESNSKYSIINTINDEIRVRKSLSQLKEEYNLKKIKPYLLINKKNTISITDNEIVFKNNTRIKL